MLVSPPMRLVGGRPHGLLPRMVNLQPQDRQTVDDEAGRFGVQGGGVILIEPLQQPHVHLLDQVVPALVEPVDGPLDPGNLRVGRGGIACLVLLVPEVEVRPVLGKRNRHQAICARLNLQIALGLMQGQGHLILHSRYQDRIEHKPGHSNSAQKDFIRFPCAWHDRG